MKRVFVQIVVLISVFSVSFVQAQQESANSKNINVSCPEKWWVMMHPFVAGKAFAITLNVMKITDSISHEKNSEFNLTPQQADAFRHAFWMASLVQEINRRKARSLGNAHERGNYRTFRKNTRQGRDDLHDEASKQMDLWNNRVGIETGCSKLGSDRKELIQAVLDSVESGSLKIIRTNPSGKFVDCNGNLIAEENYENKWINDKCLVDSNVAE
ncbi:MAG: hypothetical protein FJY07_10520 [Bacteroidetes bacterium]|nr:hypothetical protein [Bacteroidota bacterium]